MGGCVSLSPEEQQQKNRSVAIDRQLRSDLKEFENTIKILLLGMQVKIYQVRINPTAVREVNLKVPTSTKFFLHFR